MRCELQLRGTEVGNNMFVFGFMFSRNFYQSMFPESKILQLVISYLETSFPMFLALMLWCKLSPNLFVLFLRGMKSKINVVNHMMQGLPSPESLKNQRERRFVYTVALSGAVRPNGCVHLNWGEKGTDITNVWG